MNNRFEAYLDRGRLLALDTIGGNIFHVLKHERKIFSSCLDSECPYEIFYNDSGIICLLDLLTGDISPIELLVKVDDGG